MFSQAKTPIFWWWIRSHISSIAPGERSRIQSTVLLKIVEILGGINRFQCPWGWSTWPSTGWMMIDSWSLTSKIGCRSRSQSSWTRPTIKVQVYWFIRYVGRVVLASSAFCTSWRSSSGVFSRPWNMWTHVDLTLRSEQIFFSSFKPIQNEEKTLKIA